LICMRQAPGLPAAALAIESCSGVSARAAHEAKGAHTSPQWAGGSPDSRTGRGIKAVAAIECGTSGCIAAPLGCAASRGRGACSARAGRPTRTRCRSSGCRRTRARRPRARRARAATRPPRARRAARRRPARALRPGWAPVAVRSGRTCAPSAPSRTCAAWGRRSHGAASAARLGAHQLSTNCGRSSSVFSSSHSALPACKAASAACAICLCFISTTSPCQQHMPGVEVSQGCQARHLQSTRRVPVQGAALQVGRCPTCGDLRDRHPLGADARAPPLPALPPLLPPTPLAVAALRMPRRVAAAAGGARDDPGDPTTPSFARPSAWPAIHGDPAAPARGRLRLQLRASTVQAPRGRTFWRAPGRPWPSSSPGCTALVTLLQHRSPACQACRRAARLASESLARVACAVQLFDRAPEQFRASLAPVGFTNTPCHSGRSHELLPWELGTASTNEQDVTKQQSAITHSCARQVGCCSAGRGRRRSGGQRALSR